MRTYLERNPNAPEQWRWLSTELARSRRGEEAARAESNAQLADSNRARLAHRRALWYELTGETEQAREALEAAVHWQPNYEAARLDLLRLTGADSRRRRRRHRGARRGGMVEGAKRLRLKASLPSSQRRRVCKPAAAANCSISGMVYL